MLADKAIAIAGGIPSLTSSGGVLPIPIFCHTAGCYWIYHETFKQTPMGFAFDEGGFTNPTGFMTAMAKKYGRTLRSSDAGNVVNGTVLVFTTLSGNAEHTCIIRYDGEIAGYNQIGWFPSGISAHYSIDPVGTIKWANAKDHEVTLSQNRPGHLFAIDEDKAVNFMKYNFGKPF